MSIRLNTEQEVLAKTFGARGARLAAMAKLGLPVPDGLILSSVTVQDIAHGGAMPKVPEDLTSSGLLSVRSSPENLDWGGPNAILNIGINDAFVKTHGDKVGTRGAMDLYRRFIQSYAVSVDNLDPEYFENLYYDQLKLADVDCEDDLSDVDLGAMLANCKALYEEEAGRPFPQDPRDQLDGVLRATAKAWNAPTAKILRLAKGAPQDAGLSIIIQHMALGIGVGSGSGFAQMVDEKTGRARLWGRFLPQSQGQDALMGLRTPHMITKVEREEAGQTALSLQEISPVIIDKLKHIGEVAADGMGDAFQFEFTIENEEVYLLDASPAKRTARASLRIAVDLADRNAISRNEALLRIDPHNLAS